MHILVLRLILAGLMAQASDAEKIIPPDVAADTFPTPAWKQAVEFTEQVKELGPWQTQHQVIGQMVDSLFAQHGWNDESDVFARNMIVQVSALPPWDIPGRINTFTNLVGTRYQLTPEQQGDLRRRVWRDTIVVTTQSFPAVLPTLKEMLDTRAAGKPFTPEQVSRWMRNARPLIDRNVAYINKSLREFRRTLTPEQCALLDQDVAAADRRGGTMMEQMEGWMRGRWEPKDWGLERDPVHVRMSGGAQAVQAQPIRVERARQAGEKERKPVVPVRDRDKWEEYVEQFIRQHELDEAQQTSAWSIYEDLKLRADQWHASHTDELAELETRLRDAADGSARKEAQTRLDECKQPLVQMFAELQDRLENLLTSEQRSRG